VNITQHSGIVRLNILALMVPRQFVTLLSGHLNWCVMMNVLSLLRAPQTLLWPLVFATTFGGVGASCASPFADGNFATFPLPWSVTVPGEVRQLTAPSTAAQFSLLGKHTVDLIQSFTPPSGGTDYLFFTLSNASGAFVFTPTLIGATNLTLISGSGHAGLFSYSFTPPAVGNVTLDFKFTGTSDDDDKRSLVVLSSVSISAAPGPVPGAGLLSFIGLSLIGLGSAARKRLKPQDT